MRAKAIPCGNTSAAPVSPAQKSPRSDAADGFGQRNHGQSNMNTRQKTSSSAAKIPCINLSPLSKTEAA